MIVGRLQFSERITHVGGFLRKPRSGSLTPRASTSSPARVRPTRPRRCCPGRRSTHRAGGRTCRRPTSIHRCGASSFSFPCRPVCRLLALDRPSPAGRSIIGELCIFTQYAAKISRDLSGFFAWLEVVPRQRVAPRASRLFPVSRDAEVPRSRARPHHRARIALPPPNPRRAAGRVRAVA